MIKFGSVCSGIEAASVACHSFGYEAEAAWFSEIEPAPCKLLAHHYPSVPNHGDMTLLVDKILAGEVDAPDMLVGGTPCQAFSVAGKRLGLEDYRGNLTLTFTEIANAIDTVRDGRGLGRIPICWENVPGVLSDKTGAFGCFVGRLAGFDEAIVPDNGKWGKSGLVIGPRRRVAWIVADAQYFGVAQRRRRVWVVAIPSEVVERDPSKCPSKILSIGSCLRGNTPTQRTERKKSSPLAEEGSGKSIAGVYRKSARAQSRDGVETWVDDGIANTLNVFDTGERDTHAVVSIEDPVAYNITFCDANGTRKDRPDGGLYISETDTCNTITSTDIGTKVVCPVDITTSTFRQEAFGQYADDDTASTLKQRDHKDATDLVVDWIAERDVVVDIAPSLTTNDPSRSPQASEVTQQINAVFNTTGVVRRLTPEECEILQGFPIFKKSINIDVDRLNMEEICLSENQKTCVPAETKCHKSLNNVPNVEGKEFRVFVKSAEVSSSQNHQKQKELVPDIVLTFCEEENLEKHNRKKSSSNVRGVEKKNLYLQPIEKESFVRVVAPVITILEREIGCGKAESQTSIKSSIILKNGNWFVNLSGKEAELNAKDVENNINIKTNDNMKYITLKDIETIPNRDSMLKILSCYVMNVISSYIPMETLSENSFSIQINIFENYTNVCGLSDSHRYKALGNSWAVPQAAWVLGRVIEAMTK